MTDLGGLSVVSGLPLSEQPGIGALTIGGFLREVVGRHGSAEAVVAWHSGRRIAWSYDTLLAQSLEVARGLIAAGLGRDGRVGILMSNRPEFLSAFFGTALAGAVPVALSTFSTTAELDQLLSLSQVSMLLFERRVAGRDFQQMLSDLGLADAQGALPYRLENHRYPFLQRLVCLSDNGDGADALSAADGSWECFLAEGSRVSDALVMARADMIMPSDPGGIFFSSGTTSLPKGIIHAHRAFAIQWWRWGWTMGWPGPVRIWTANGLFWSANIVMMVGIAFSTGGAIVLQPTFSAAEALRVIERERVTFLNGRPHQWAQLQLAPGWPDADLSAVKYITRGELIRDHPTVDTDWEVPMAFGTTETMTVCTGFPASTPKEIWGDSSGVPFPGNTLKIVDPVSRAPVLVGEIGEMCIKGPTLMAGYLGKAHEDCFDPEGFYPTADAGYVDEQGRFFWKGRMSEMIKTGGANVSPEEVDQVLASCPGIQRSQTLGVPDDLLGERVVACIVPREGTTLDEGEIRIFARERLAAFKVPRTIFMFSEQEIAVTGSEKIKVGELRELVLKRMAEGAT